MRALAARQMRANIALIPEGRYRSTATIDSDGVVNQPLTIALAVTRTRRGAELRLRRLVAALRRADEFGAGHDAVSSVYLAMRHIFPEVPISAGAFEPLAVTGIEGTFLDAQYPRPVSGCAAEVSQRIAEAVFAALVQALPDRVTAAPAGTSGNFGLGGHDPERGRDYVMYQISGGGYGGNADHDGLATAVPPSASPRRRRWRSWSRIYPVLYRRYALHEGSGGAGRHRGGFGLDYEVELLRGTARASFVMDHGRVGPQGALGGGAGGVNRVEIIRRDGSVSVPEHLSKAQDIAACPRRPGAGAHARRRRLRRSGRPRSCRGGRGCPAGPLQPRGRGAAVPRPGLKRSARRAAGGGRRRARRRRRRGRCPPRLRRPPGIFEKQRWDGRARARVFHRGRRAGCGGAVSRSAAVVRPPACRRCGCRRTGCAWSPVRPRRRRRGR